MARLTPADFTKFFTAIHDHAPFPWQQQLVEQLAREHQWPDVLDLPTGTGKTAALDAAVFHLALQQAVKPRRAALRIVLVVDRRLVVDDAYHRARKIACALADRSRAKAGRSVVGEVARRLQRLAGADAPPLVAAKLRGGAPLEDDWARTPTQPTILCSTVDQVGSRLLFRGYGVSNRMQPVHAGLLGDDTLILLDEAHLSQPFQDTLKAVRELDNAKVTTVVLTATPGSDYQRPFRLNQEDRKHAVLQPRLKAAKRVKLLQPIRSPDPVGAFTSAARAQAERLHRAGVAAPAVGVVVNRVDLARAIFARLNATEDAPFDCLLLIGRSRDVDRDQAEARLAPFRTGAEGRGATRPLMVVATQCLEVGVDLDLDALVTQAASLDALRQRFGRLNRAGRPIPAAGAILVTTESLAKKADDPVYGDRIRKTWDTLTAIADKEGRVDFASEALDRRLRRAKVDVAGLAAPRAAAPVLMPAYLELWAQTSPPPATDPEVGLFLHGTEQAAPEVSVVWRSDITSADLAAGDVDKLAAVLELVRPRSAEMIDVPIWAAAAWLRRWSTARAAQIADVAEREVDLEVEQSETDRKAFRWAGAGDPRTGLVDHAELRPGDVLVVPADYGGCDAYGWAPVARDPVTDVADEAAWPYRGRRLAVRVTPDVAHWDRLAAVLASSDDDPDLEELLAALPDVADEDPPAAGRRRRDVRRQLEVLGQARRVETHRPYGALPDRGIILVAPRGLAGERGALPVTEDDSASNTAGGPVTLDDHSADVVGYVDCFASTLGLSDQVADDLRLAAVLHDEGKTDPRFQLFLAGADWWNRPDVDPLAKSGRSLPRGAWERAELPKGWRHEALSVRLATAHARFAEAHDPHLVLWLIGTHHGLGRPFFGFSDPQDGNQGPQSPTFDLDGLDWSSLFDRLKRRYGVWGLARLEAILRLADHRASEAGQSPRIEVEDSGKDDFLG